MNFLNNEVKNIKLLPSLRYFFRNKIKDFKDKQKSLSILVLKVWIPITNSSSTTWKPVRSTGCLGPALELLNLISWMCGPVTCLNKPSRQSWCILTLENESLRRLLLIQLANKNKDDYFLKSLLFQPSLFF